jgi:cytochrome c2
MRLLVCFVAVSVAACGGRTTTHVDEVVPGVSEVLAAQRYAWSSAERQRAISEGRALIERHQCNRCHVIDDVPASSRPTHCVSCHVFLDGLDATDHAFTTIASRYGQAVIERYQRNIEHFVAVPDLTLVAKRLRPEWIARFVRDPHDLRPLMDETMVRTVVSEAEARVIATYFAAIANVAPPREGDVPELGPRPTRARVAEGERLFRERACNTCHTVGNIPTGKTESELRAVGVAARLAPNLRFTRERLDRD